MMRRTGKLYSLTLVSSGLTILASLLVIRWNEHSSAFHMWFDIVPQAFGMASVITTTLIVRGALFQMCAFVLRKPVGNDSWRLQGGYGDSDGQ